MNKPQQVRRSLVESSHYDLSVTRQCELVGIHRSLYYYQPKGESELNLMSMKSVSAGCTRFLALNRLLPNQIPRSPISKTGSILTFWGIWRLIVIAVIDLYSRFVVGWSLSNTMQAEWCKQVLEQAIEDYGTPEIVNTGQGSQFTSEVFTGFVIESGIQMSMDGKGRAIDNVFIERLWRSVKYEQVYLYPADDGLECYQGLKQYFQFYNYQRRHASIDHEMPANRYQESTKKAAWVDNWDGMWTYQHLSTSYESPPDPPSSTRSIFMIVIKVLMNIYLT